MKTCIILEDEQLASNRLVRLLEEINPGLEIQGVYDSIEELTSILKGGKHPDLLLLDIHVSDGNSFSIFNLVDIRSKIIFTTAYDQYAIDAFRQNAIDYLLKPIKQTELEQALDKAEKYNVNDSADYKKRFLINFGNKLHSLQVNDIAYIFSQNKISYFVSQDGSRIPSDYSLKDIIKLLNPNHFFRANRQYIVHIDSIENIKRHDASRVKLYLNPPVADDIVVSTEKTKKFKEWLDR